jgi:hypothetical protein
VGAAREAVLIGTTCIEVGFGEPEDVAELAALNPPSTIERLRRELAAEVAASGQLIRPWEQKG